MEWVNDNFSTLLIVLGIALLAIEVGLLGLSVFILFFVGLACITTGLLTMMGLVPQTLVAAFGGVAILSLVFAVLLWKPMQKLQVSKGPKDVKGDFIGHTFKLESSVSPDDFGTHQYSGITWKIKSEQTLSAGTLVEVIKAEVGELTVAAKSA